MSNQQATMSNPTITLEHTYAASPAAIWTAWTTADGIASWWSPDGFTTTVDQLDLTVGGDLVHTMAASSPEMVAFMESQGLPLATTARKTFVELDEPRRIAYSSLVDFVPGTPAYDHLTTVDIEPAANGTTKVTMTVEPLHDEEWTGRMLAGRQNELENLAKVLG